MKRLYETTIVLDPQLKSAEIEDAVKKVTNFISNHGGEIVKVDEWGKRRLAYEINKKQYGYYVHIRFNGPGSLIKLLEREYRLSESILRYLTVKVDKLALKAEKVQQEREAAAAEPPAEAPAEAEAKGEAAAETTAAEAETAASEESAAETADEPVTEEAATEEPAAEPPVAEAAATEPAEEAAEADSAEEPAPEAAAEEGTSTEPEEKS